MPVTLNCPICKTALNQKQRVYLCSNNHTFDIAKEGYTNLLLVNQKSSPNPGDDKDMVVARRQFLEQKYYDCIVSNLTHVIKKYTDLSKLPLNVLDSGCGDGYYTSLLKEQLNAENIKINAYGMDLSKYALQTGAKRHPTVKFFVSNINYDFPFANDSFDFVLNIFSPRNSKEFNRVLSSHGKLIVIYLGPRHLEKLREALNYTMSYIDKPTDIGNTLSAEFVLIDAIKITSKLDLPSDMAKLLAAMSPIFWQVDQLKAKGLGDIQGEIIDFNLDVFSKV